MFQICYEFNRIVGKNLSISFLQALDQIAPNMIEIFKKKTGTMGQKLNQIILEAKVSFRSVYFILFVYLFISSCYLYIILSSISLHVLIAIMHALLKIKGTQKTQRSSKSTDPDHIIRIIPLIMFN